MRPRSLLRVVLTTSGMTLAGVGATLLLPAPTSAAEIVVTTNEDSLAGDGKCSLREAILAANTNAAVDSCPAGETADADVILLDVTQTYRLTIPGAGEDLGLTGDLDITDEVSIWNAESIDGGGLDRVFDVHPGAGLLGLHVAVVTNGDAGTEDGGAIRVRQPACPDTAGGRTRIVTGNHFVGNVARNGGAVSIEGCGRLDVWGSATFEDNEATGDGGALWMSPEAILYVETTTFTGNRAGGAGGAVWASPSFLSYSIAATTIADNHASVGGGLALGPGTGGADLLNVILARNGGGNCAFEMEIEGHHVLSDDASCGDLGPNSISNVDARLDVLSDAFGLPSYGLLPDSPAIDAGRALSFETEPAYDQRSTERPVDGDGDGVATWDIGSVEAVFADPEPTEPGRGGTQPPPPVLPNTATDGPASSLPAAWLAFVVGIALAARRFARRHG